MTSTELDAELLSRLDPSKFKDVSELNETCWFGYRFAHPTIRVLAFMHYYSIYYLGTARLLGRNRLKPAWTRGNPLAGLSKAHLTAVITATFVADSHGIPYDFFLEKVMELHIRLPITMTDDERKKLPQPPMPNQLYLKSSVTKIIDAWGERNRSGIYVAKAPQFHVSAYEGHPIQDAYMDYLCEAISNKGNRPFYIARLMFDIGHLTEERAVLAFGRDMVARAHDHK